MLMFESSVLMEGAVPKGGQIECLQLFVSYACLESDFPVANSNTLHLDILAIATLARQLGCRA